LQVGRYREGLAAFSNDASLAFFALTNLGICFDKLGQLDNAKKEFTEALDIAVAHSLPLRDQVPSFFKCGT
jgi:Tfp pilus assembly protein PilF